MKALNEGLRDHFLKLAETYVPYQTESNLRYAVAEATRIVLARLKSLDPNLAGQFVQRMMELPVSDKNKLASFLFAVRIPTYQIVHVSGKPLDNDDFRSILQVR